VIGCVDDDAASYRGIAGDRLLRKNLNFVYGDRVVSVGWVSFQPDGSISFGLRDRTFVLESSRTRIDIWNAYNRVQIQYIAPKVAEPLLPVENPHFTFHPPIQFQLKSNTQKISKDEQIFSGIADVQFALTQQREMPWIRATSAPLSELKRTATRSDGTRTEEYSTAVPVIFSAASGAIEIDFIRLEDVRPELSGPTWEIAWINYAIRISLKSVGPQIATLSWFHAF
jgi:hypothetical protein